MTRTALALIPAALLALTPTLSYANKGNGLKGTADFYATVRGEHAKPQTATGGPPASTQPSNGAQATGTASTATEAPGPHSAVGRRHVVRRVAHKSR